MSVNEAPLPFPRRVQQQREEEDAENAAPAEGIQALRNGRISEVTRNE